MTILRGLLEAHRGALSLVLETLSMCDQSFSLPLFPSHFGGGRMGELGRHLLRLTGAQSAQLYGPTDSPVLPPTSPPNSRVRQLCASSLPDQWDRSRHRGHDRAASLHVRAAE